MCDPQEGIALLRENGMPNDGEGDDIDGKCVSWTS